MTNKVQKIRKEVERLKEETSIGLSEHENGVEQGRMEIINALSLFLDSLQEEPISENLEEACEQLAENARKHKAETSSPFFSQTDYKQGVMDGAKWQKHKDIELADTILTLARKDIEENTKQQMMKDAVEGYIERDKGGQLILGRTNLGAGDEFMLLDASTFHDIKCGDRRKAKIMIIIKED